MSERRYTDEEVAAIFKQAAETESAVSPLPAEGNGTTLAALQEIGREVGISPEAISHAAQSLERAGKPAGRTFMGFPIGVGRTVEFDRPLTDVEWESLVGDLRETFSARGRVQYDGPFRQWTNGNLQALVEPLPGGHRLRLQTMNGASRRLMSAGLLTMGLSAAAWIALTVASTLGDPGSIAGIGFTAVAGIVMFVIGAMRLPGWARKRRAQIEAVVARVTAAVAKDTG
ncbi:MAG TPA: hypothetical protein VID74_01370 [Gemmatimonadales bacterium]|jgi:hypothetical protein